MNLVESLRKFDGKKTAVLERLSSTMPRNDDSVAELLAVAEHDNAKVQVGATWILKQWLDDGTPQVEKSVPQLIRLLKNATHWEVRLHILQMLATLRVPTRSLPVLQKRLPDLLTDDNKLIRAWALSVLAVVADQRESLRRDVVSRLREAENDDAASVRARVRQIQKRFEWASQTGRTER